MNQSSRVLDTYSKNQLTTAPVLVKLIALKELADDLGIGDVLSLMKVDVPMRSTRHRVCRPYLSTHNPQQHYEIN